MTTLTSILCAIGCFLIVLLWDLFTDYKKWINERSINHDKEGWIRGLFLIPAIGFLCVPLWADWWFFFIPVAVVTSVYWMLFDGFYGILRKEGFWFTGTDDWDDARSDNFLQSLSLSEHILIKVGFVTMSILAYILVL